MDPLFNWHHLAAPKEAFMAKAKVAFYPPVLLMPKKVLVMPASGKIIYGFGGRDMTGKKRQGITIKTRSSSLVTAPSQGRVTFVGKFRDYGHMVILNQQRDIIF